MEPDIKALVEKHYESFLDKVYEDIDDLGACLFWEFATKDHKMKEMYTGVMCEEAFGLAFDALYDFDAEGLCEDIESTFQSYVKYQKELADDTRRDMEDMMKKEIFYS